MQRQLYEFAVMSELKNALRSGDVWVLGSRQFKDFDEYLLPARRSLTAPRAALVAARMDATYTNPSRDYYTLR